MGRPTAVSVVIASYNGAGYLPEAIDSVLAQTHPAIEVIVVDDGSTDGTQALLAAYGSRVRCLWQANAGPCAARNAGLRAAGGAYVVYLDHDDRLKPEKVARQAAVLDVRPDVGLVYCGWQFIDEVGQPTGVSGWPRHEGPFLADVVVDNPIHLAAAMLRRESLVAVGGFDERRTAVEDWDLWLRLSRRGIVWACVDAPLVEYRVHRGQRHKRGIERVLTNRLAVLEELFADPTLPAFVRALAPVAYQNAYLRAAADYVRAGQRAEAAEAFHAAARARPALLVEPRTLRRFCRLLEPMGFHGETSVVGNWRTAARALRTTVADVLARPGLDPALARLSWGAHLAVLRVTVRLARKRLVTVLAPSLRHPR